MAKCELIDRSLLDIPSDENMYEELVKFADDVACADEVEAVSMEKIDEILDKFSKWMWSEHEDVCGNQMIDIGYAEGYLRELFDWERKWEDEE